MARSRTTASIRLPTWLRHRQLLTTEAVLLIALGMELLQRWVTTHQDVPWWLKTLEVMLVNAGMLGGLLLVLTTWTKGSLERAAGAARGMPIPAALLLVHLAVLGAIFTLYAKVWGFWPQGRLF